MKNIDVLGVEFKNKTLLFNVLGYKNTMSENFINQNYKNIENMVKTRLGIDSNDLASKKLQELKDNYIKENTGGRAPGKKVVTNQIDPAVLNVFVMAYQQLNADSKDLIIKTTARAFNIDVSSLYDKIDHLVQ